MRTPFLQVSMLLAAWLMLSGVASAQSLEQAVKELTAEAESYVKDNAMPLRATADYFRGSEATDTQAVIDVIAQRLHRDPFVDAYVKWQLLSAVPGNLEADQGKVIYQAYQSAPEVGLDPGADPAIQRELSTAARGLDQTGALELSNKWKMLHDQRNARNVALMEYRSELLARLPDHPQVLLMQFKDLQDRVTKGHIIRVALTNYEARVITWAALATPQEKQEMLKTFRRTPGGQMKEVYTDLIFNNNQATWTKGRVQFPKNFADKMAPNLQ